jgi:putative peptide zinc metalloprotease protein
VHGLDGATTQALRHPELLLPVFVLGVVSGVAHELGHAAALRYGGGRARGMGMGLYLVFPAFYTDTTDAYRLSRGARVRTDLGGFFFHLLFATVLIAVAALTGQDYLLILVVLINFDVLRQCIPLLRMDGYWTLTDLTGIPDLLTQVGPFLRSIVRRRATGAHGATALKRSSVAILAGYTTVLIPFLAVALIFAIAGLPHTVRTAWSSVRVQADALTIAVAAGDVGVAGVTVLRMALLALPPIAVTFALLSVVLYARDAARRRRYNARAARAQRRHEIRTVRVARLAQAAATDSALARAIAEHHDLMHRRCSGRPSRIKLS